MTRKGDSDGGDAIHDTDPAVADTAGPPEPAAPPSVTRTPRLVRSGDVLGRYELGEELGEGGMATVFRARDRDLRRDVALKVLFPHLARRPEIVKRFHREARAAAGLEHANILRIYDVGGGEGDDPPYIVMELIRGRTLLEEIEQRGPMLAEIAACVGALLADALSAAHAALIVHRDIKPSNVLIAPGGRLLLADFGVARLETESSLVTRTGALLGTPAYMSPEQASGDTATARSDLYSLGATLYQLATGHLPYAGSAAKVMSQIAAGTLVTPVRRRASVGPDLSRVIEQLMATEPAARPDTATAVAAELRELAAKGGLGDPTEELAAYFADPAAFVTTKTQTIVTAILATAERAIAEERLPRAMALADRASALAPDDPAVEALVSKVTEGGRASRRRKVIALGGLGVLVAGGATALGLSINGSTPAVPDAAIAADDASVIAPTTNDTLPLVPVDVAPPDAADAPVDAKGEAVRPRDAGVRDSAAGVAPLTTDAFVPPVLDAAPLAVPPPDARLEYGTLVVVNDTWCEVTIDGVVRGKIMQTKTYELAVGSHTVRCEQSGIDMKWVRTVEVTAGRSVTARGELLIPAEVAITVGDLTIDGVAYARGTVHKLKPGRYRAQVGTASYWLDIPRVGRCKIREDGGRLVCDP